MTMSRSDPLELELTPNLLMRAYRVGIFPMARSASARNLVWVDPDVRGILPLDGFHLSKSLKKAIRRGDYEIRVNTDFDQVIRACAAPRLVMNKDGTQREWDNETWISKQIIELYTTLFHQGHCHTIEVWRANRMIGGLYGVSIGGVFFGESMFHRETDASKIALTYLVAGLKLGGYELLDTQFVTDHLVSLGAIEIERATYHTLLEHALKAHSEFFLWSGGGTSDVCLQSISQIS